MHKLTEISAELARADNARDMLKSSAKVALIAVGLAAVVVLALVTLF